MFGGYDGWSDAALFLILLVVFLAHKLRWKESSFDFAMCGVMSVGAFGKFLVLIGPAPKIPLFLTLYLLLMLVFIVMGIYDLRKEQNQQAQ